MNPRVSRAKRGTSLPDGCCVCRGGFWVIGPNGGAQRCACARGIALSEMNRQSTGSPPRIGGGNAAHGGVDGKMAAAGGS